MNYIDIHCHLGWPDYDSDRERVLERMEDGGVGAITVGTDLESSKKAVEIAEANENIWATIGIHPEHATSPRSASRSDPLLDTGEGKNAALPPHLGEGQSRLAGWDEVEFEKLVISPKVVAIGECGLEYFHLDKDTASVQKKLFESQIQFAIKHNKPLMLHIREAYDDAIEILKNYEKARGNVHFFAGDTSVAKRFLDLGFSMSFTGVITFAHDYDEVVRYIPRGSIMSETDTPFVAPASHRGKRNEPSFVVEVVRKLSEIRGEDEADLREAMLKNAKRFFGLPN